MIKLLLVLPLNFTPVRWLVFEFSLQKLRAVEQAGQDDFQRWFCTWPFCGRIIFSLLGTKKPR